MNKIYRIIILISIIFQGCDSGGSDTIIECPTGVYDCEGTCDGTIIEDCAGVCGGDSYEDMCNECDNDPNNDCVQDCTGEWAGDALIDCAGDCAGNAYLDDCGVCVQGTTGLEECVSITINASSYDDWIYFSFETENIITVNNPENSLDWDVGFKRNHIKTNSGLSGIGDACGIVDNTQLWTDVFESTQDLPTNFTCQIDDIIEGSLLMQQGCYCGSLDQAGCENLLFPNDFIDCVKNPALDTWGWFDNDRTLNITNYMMFIKDINGNYIKFWPSSYKNANGETGIIDITYQKGIF